MAYPNVGPGRKLAAITPSDTTVIYCRAVWVGNGGNIAVIAAEDTAPVTITNVQGGTMLDISCTKIMATNTTASGIVGVS